MNRLILKYGFPITVIILAIFAGVVYQRLSRGWSDVVVLAVAAVIVWAVGAPAFILLWPRITVHGYKQAIVKHGLGGGPIPVNTIYAVPESPSQSTSVGNVIATGTDDILYFGGWLDVKAGPQVLQVPEMDDRYYSMQFTDPTSGANFAYVGTRTTGTAIDADERWALVARLLHDDTIELTDRVAGALLLCYGQQLSRIAVMTTEQVHRRHDPDIVSLRFGAHDITVP